MKKVIVCGGRNFNDVPLLWRTLDRIAHNYGGIKRIIDGASDDVTGPYKGADYWANQWAIASGIPTHRCHAEWKIHGKSAGPIRNQAMLNEKPDLVVAFPGGYGTADMVRRARAAGIEVVAVKAEQRAPD